MLSKTILLINPPTGIYDRADRCQAPIEDEGIEMIRPPMDLAYMAAMVEKAGGKAIIRDYPAEKKGWKDFQADLKLFKPDFLVISVTTPTLNLDLRSSAIAKKLNPEIITLAKGAHFYEFDKKILSNYRHLDLVIRGEAEPIIEEIIKGVPFSKIRGITYRQGKKIFRNRERPFIADLDRLPFPARHLLNNDLYRFPDTNEPYALVLSGRGCPGQCIFCLVGKVSGNVLRTRSVKKIIGEIESCIKDFGIKTFFFRADTFTWKRKWVFDFCDGVISKRLGIRWGTNSRVDTLDEEMVIKMRQAGCEVVGLGIESGCQEMLDKMGKNITLKETTQAVEICHKHGLKTLLFFIIGLPWESKETIERTIDFAKKLPGTFYNFSLAYPFPGTKLAEIAEKNNLLTKSSLYGFDYANPAIKTFFLSSKELIYFRKKALKQIYFRISYFMRVLGQIHSFRELRNYFFSGLEKAIKVFVNER